MKLFLDANVLVSVLNKEYPLFTHTARILSLAGTDKYRLFTSPICLAIAFYFAEKKCGASQAKKKIQILVENLGIATTDESVVKQAAHNQRILDYEDGLEYYAALNTHCDAIITEDVNDFYFSAIPVLQSEQFLKQYIMKD